MKNEPALAQNEFILKGITKSYGSLRVLDGISLAVEKDRIVAILGPSGCGKTTLLVLLAGSLLPDSGEIIGLAGKAVSFLFQEPRLLDWLTVAENIAFVLKDRFPPAEVEARVAGVLRRVELAEPAALSHAAREAVLAARLDRFRRLIPALRSGACVPLNVALRTGGEWVDVPLRCTSGLLFDYIARDAWR